MYWKQDHRFNLPKIAVLLSVSFNGINSVKNELCSSFYISMMN